MNASEITFGIEIETTIPAGALPVGSYTHGAPVVALPGWTAKYDGSIRARGSRQGCEFVSPVLKGAEGVESMLAAIRYIKSIGAEVNASCGLHVHVGFDKTNVVASVKLATLVANFEKAIFASTGTKSRERGTYCRPMQQYGTADRALQSSRGNRYHLCNFASEHATVEFRAFAATLNESKIIGHVAMCVALVERALTAKRVTNWVAPAVSETSPIRRNGEGQTALTRLFYQLGWIKGRTSHTFGNIAPQGKAAIDVAKRALMKMARKYDAR